MPALRRWSWLGLILCAFSASRVVAAQDDPPVVLFIAGAPSHGPGEHRFPDGCRLLADALNASGLPLRAEVREGWPDAEALARAATVVIYSDGIADHVARGHVTELRAHVAAGRGLAVLHFALEPEPGELADFLLEQLGGCFETDWSVNPVWKPEPELAAHEVTRGVRAFAVEDEWYFHLRFRDGVVPVLRAVPPARSLGADGPRSGNAAVRAAVQAGTPQTLAWVNERAGARAFGFTGGHFHRNWAGADFRKLVLNAIVWTAHGEVPADGVASTVAPIPRYATLDEAIARDAPEDVRLHVARNPGALNTANPGRLLPLHQAILRNRTAVARLLLELGADVDAADRSHRTPLHLAVERGNLELVQALLGQHARANALDQLGWTPLHHAAAKNQVAIARALVAGGADVQVRSERGGTPLHEAAASGGAEMIQLLLDAGADPAVVSKLGVTALDIAREFKNEAAIAALAKVTPARAD